MTVAIAWLFVRHAKEDGVGATRGDEPLADTPGMDYVFAVTMDGKLNRWPLQEMLSGEPLPSAPPEPRYSDAFHLAIHPHRFTYTVLLTPSECTVRSPAESH